MVCGLGKFYSPNSIIYSIPLAELEDEPFIFVAFNYFTKTISNEIYIPAEFAACQFSLKSGKTSIYSSHINPGKLLPRTIETHCRLIISASAGHLIFGQGSDAQQHATTTHQLPLPPLAMGDSDMGRLYSNIVEYLSGLTQSGNNAEEKKPLVVFTCTDLLPVVKGCFKYLACDSDSANNQILVYDIQYLFYVLKKEVMDLADLPHDNINKCITDNLFLNDFFEYQAGISCQVSLQRILWIVIENNSKFPDSFTRTTIAASTARSRW